MQVEVMLMRQESVQVKRSHAQTQCCVRVTTTDRQPSLFPNSTCLCGGSGKVNQELFIYLSIYIFIHSLIYIYIYNFIYTCICLYIIINTTTIIIIF